MDPVRAVDHVQLPIPFGSVARARAFYEAGLGLRELRDPALDQPGTLRFSLGWQRLDLREGHYTGVAPQAHLALQVADVGRIAQRLRDEGSRVDDGALHEGRVYVEDPFGNRLELIEPQPSVGRLDLATLRMAV